MSHPVAALRLPLVSATPAEILHSVATFVSRLVKNLQHRREVRALAESDAYLLKDIGLTPSDVSAALDRPWGTDPSQHLLRVAAGRSRSAPSF